MTNQNIEVITIDGGEVVVQNLTYDLQEREDRRIQGRAIQAMLNEMARSSDGLDKRAVAFWAEALNWEYPQYKGHWDGDEWEVGTVTRRIETKMGVAFEAGDVTLVKRPTFLGFSRTAFSFRNVVDTAVG